jgi:hypothetical protein
LRINVNIGQSIKILDTQGRRKGFSIQNVGAVDVYFSDDQRLLDTVSSANLPTAGHLLAASAPAPPPTVYNFFIGQIFVRSQSTGAQLELIVFDVDPC